MGLRGLQVYLLVALVACGDDGNNQQMMDDAGVIDPDGMGSGGDDAIVPGMDAPQFGGVSHAFASNAGEVSLFWLEALDDTTPHSAMTYHVFTGPDPDAVAQLVESMAAPTLSVTGASTAVLTGQTPDVALSIIVIAEDADGQRSANRDASNITPTSVQLVIKKTPKVLADLGITVVELGVDSFRVSGGSFNTLAVGDLILVESQLGRGLREITQVTGSGTSRDLTTTRASLAEIMESGSLRSTATLVETPQPMAMALNPGHRAGFTQSKAPATVNLGPLNAIAGLDTEAQLSYEVYLAGSLEGEINMRGDLPGTPESIVYIATGKLGIEGIASYTISGAKEFKSEKELFERKLTLRYAVAGMPVHQTVTMKLMASLEMKADTAFNATLNVQAEKYIRYGFAWSPENGFMPIKDNGFTQTTTFSLTGEASATATLKIYPVLETTLYGVATASITIDPTLDLAAKARLLPLPAELEKFDIDFSVGLQIAADLSILGKSLWKWESDRFELVRIPLFSLPEVKLMAPKSANICHPAKFLALISDGYNNPVPNGNTHINYEIMSGSGTLMPATGGRQVLLDTMTPGEHTVRIKAWGDGPLGVLGARYAEATVDVVDPGQDCTMVPPPADVGPPLHCNPSDGYNGLTAPIYFTKTRVAIGEVAGIVLPMRYVDTSLRVMLGLALDHTSMTNVTPERWILDQSLLPFTGEYLTGHIFNTDTYGHSGVGWWRPFFSISCPGAFCPTMPVNTTYVDYLLTYTEPACGDTWDQGGVCHLSSTHWVQAATLGPDPNTSADDEHCETFNSGIYVPTIEVVGPRTPTDLNESVDTAEPFAHGVRRKQNLQPFDHDWFRRNPPGTGGSGLFDAERPPPSCDVVVELTVDVPTIERPELVIYRGENDAKNDTNRVARGFSPVRFTPDPSSVYFVRVRNSTSTQIGDYMAEIKSDCTQSTVFPSITGSPVGPASVVVDPFSNTMIQIDVPVDGLTTHVEVLIDQLGAPYAYASNYVEVTGAPTTVSVPVGIPPNTPAGNYYISVAAIAADENGIPKHKRTYGLYSGFSTSLYAERFENLVVSPSTDEIRPGLIPMTPITLTAP